MAGQSKKAGCIRYGNFIFGPWFSQISREELLNEAK